MELKAQYQEELIDALGEFLSFSTLDKVVAELIEFGIIEAQIGARKVSA